MNRKIIIIFSIFILASCAKKTNYDLGQKVDSKFLGRHTNKYVLLNSAEIGYLIETDDDREIACDKNGTIIYIQTNNLDFEKSLNKKVGDNISDLLQNGHKLFVEPGVCYFIKLKDGWLGYLDSINHSIDYTNLKIKYFYKKKYSTIIGNINYPMIYDDYIKWLKNSVLEEKEPIFDREFLQVEM